METLLQQECSTETQLETYKSQLGLVEEQLKVGASETDIADLSQLRENLSQLIALTEEALLDLKKQRLLLSLQPLNKDPTTAESGNLFSDEEQAREGREDGEGERGGSVYEEENDDLQGIKCQAPLKESWGAVNYHNAVILCREEESDEGEGEGGGVKVRVFFTHPTYNAMKPCPFHLDGMCKFKNTCKFSHGHVALFSELLTYQEPDYSLACVGGRCIAKYSDGLWYQAIISSFDEEFTVHIPSLNATLQTALENVFPLEGSESSESGASSESEIDEEEEVVVEWTPSGAQRALGEWEKHTTGIGSKLMAKMGYVVGKGLGKRGEGRIEPVEIKILPAGKSLDMCAEMREKGKLRKAPGEEGGSGKRRKRRKRKLAEAAGLQETERERVNVFDFLNDKLRKNNSTADIPVASRSKSKNLNVQFFTVQEEIKSVLKRRQSLKTQLARHKGKDKTMEAHVLEKLSSTDKELKRLQAEEQRIEKDIALKSERKKLRIF